MGTRRAPSLIIKALILSGQTSVRRMYHRYIDPLEKGSGKLSKQGISGREPFMGYREWSKNDSELYMNLLITFERLECFHLGISKG